MNSTKRSFTILTRLIEAKLNGKTDVPSNLRGKKGLELLKENLAIVFSENELTYEGEFFIKGTADGVSVLCKIDMEDEENEKRYVFSLLDHFSILHIPNEGFGVKQERTQKETLTFKPEEKKESEPTSTVRPTNEQQVSVSCPDKKTEEDTVMISANETSEKDTALSKFSTTMSKEPIEEKIEGQKVSASDTDDNRQQELDEPEMLSPKTKVTPVEKKPDIEELESKDNNSLEDDFIKGLHLNPFESFDSLDDLDDLPVI